MGWIPSVTSKRKRRKTGGISACKNRDTENRNCNVRFKFRRQTTTTISPWSRANNLASFSKISDTNTADPSIKYEPSGSRSRLAEIGATERNRTFLIACAMTIISSSSPRANHIRRRFPKFIARAQVADGARGSRLFDTITNSIPYCHAEGGILREGRASEKNASHAWSFGGQCVSHPALPEMEKRKSKASAAVEPRHC